MLVSTCARPFISVVFLSKLAPRCVWCPKCTLEGFEARNCSGTCGDRWSLPSPAASCWWRHQLQAQQLPAMRMERLQHMKYLLAARRQGRERGVWPSWTG